MAGREEATVSAGMVAIGDEVLSGRTKDRNIGHLASVLTLAGIDLVEVRIVGDRQKAIVEAVNALRERYDYVFTSGGIGPTHDDITADAIGAAFGRPVHEDERALDLLGRYYAGRELEFTPARRRMTRMPEGSELIANPISVAPGFRVENVMVMAGVPSIFAAMVDNVLPTLRTGAVILSETVPCQFGEGDIGDALAALQKAHPNVAIGSYPKSDGQRYSTDLVARARDRASLDEAVAAIRKMIGEREGAGSHS